MRCDGRPRPKLTSISSFLTVCVRVRTWISLPPSLPLLPLLLPTTPSVPFPLAVAGVVSSVVAVEERDGGGGEWRFGSPFRAEAAAAAIAAATADAACSIIAAAAVAFRGGAQFLSRKLSVDVIRFELREGPSDGNEGGTFKNLGFGSELPPRIACNNGNRIGWAGA